MLEARDRIFIYLRVSSMTGELARSKVRELAGLGNALADLSGELLSKEEITSCGTLRFDYVEADTHQPLISMFTDAERMEQVVAGRIPPRYQRRMLNDPPRIDLASFEKRAGRELDPTARQDLGEHLRLPSWNVLELIQANLAPDGSFEIRLPLE